MEKEHTASLFYAPYCKRITKPDRKWQKQRSTHYKVSAVSIHFSFPSLWKS